MDYKKIYNSIVLNRKNNVIEEGYYETHHIVPRSLGGDDSKDNLVRLTGREHFVCHYLLAKMHKFNSREWHKTNHAFMMMKASSEYNERYMNSRLYESLKENFSIVMSVTQGGENNSQYGNMWIYNPNTRENRRISKNEPCPPGFIKGRKRVWNIKTCLSCQTKYEGIGKTCSPECNKTFITERNKEIAYNEFEKFINSSAESITSYAKSTNTSQPRLTMMFNKHIIGYAQLVQHGKATSKKELKTLLNIK